MLCKLVLAACLKLAMRARQASSSASSSFFKCSFAGGVDRGVHRVPVPGGELDRAVHQVPDGAGPAEGLPGDEAVPGDEVQDAEGERKAGASAPVRWGQTAFPFLFHVPHMFHTPQSFRASWHSR